MQKARQIQGKSVSSLNLTRGYFFLFIGGSGFLTFMTLFYKRLGLSGEQIGLIATITSIVTLVMSPLSSAVSSRFGQPVRFLQYALGGSSILILLLSQQKIFLSIALIIALNAVLMSGVEPISTNFAIDITQKIQRAGYGSIRLWGAAGWAAITFAAGWLIETFSMLSSFIGYSLTMLISVLILNRLYKNLDGFEHTTQSAKLFPDLKLIVRDRLLIGLMLSLAINWVSRLGIIQFETLYLDQLGASETLIGVAWSLGAIIEIPCMLWADVILKKWKAAWLLFASIFLDILRVTFVLIAPAISTILLNRVIDGIAYAFFDIAFVIFIRERAPAGQNATYQAFFLVTLANLLTIIAAPYFGRIFDTSGGYALYKIAFGGILLSLIIFSFTVIPKTESK